MGMFDTVELSRVQLAKALTEKQLEEFPTNENFQTKSMLNGLHVYHIEDDGRLLMQQFDDTYRITSAPEPTKRPTKYTGSMRFYTFFDIGEECYWIELTANFITGKLDTLVLNEWKLIEAFNPKSLQNGNV